MNCKVSPSFFLSSLTLTIYLLLSLSILLSLCLSPPTHLSSLFLLKSSLSHLLFNCEKQEIGIAIWSRSHPAWSRSHPGSLEELVHQAFIKLSICRHHDWSGLFLYSFISYLLYALDYILLFFGIFGFVTGPLTGNVHWLGSFKISNAPCNWGKSSICCEEIIQKIWRIYTGDCIYLHAYIE